MEDTSNESVELSIFDKDSEYQEIDREESKRAVKRARNGLILAAVIIIVSECYALYRYDEPIEWNIFTIIYLILFPTALFTFAIASKYKKPYTMLSIGLAVYLVYILSVGVIKGIEGGILNFLLALWSGILYKGVIIYYLIKVLPKAKKLQAYYDQNLDL